MKWFGVSFVAVVDAGCVVPGTLENTCTPCRESNQCKEGGFCCPAMKLCVASSSQGCPAPTANCNPRCYDDAGCKCKPTDGTSWEDWANPTCPDPKKPAVLQVSYQAPEVCKKKYPTYRLTMTNGGLVLVALNKDGSSADPSIHLGDGFECQGKGIFDSVTVPTSSCLKLTMTSPTQLDSGTDIPCVTDNSNCQWRGDDAKAKWTFAQEGMGLHYCMKDPTGMSQCPITVPTSDFQVTDTSDMDQCSDKWQIKVLKKLTVSNISLQAREEPSCDDCQGVGNFACAIPNGCMKAASEKVCARFGKWCPSAPTPPPPSPTPAACASHPACAGLTGECCPTKDDEFLECCKNGFFI